MGPEETECRNCGGTGVVREEVPMEPNHPNRSRRSRSPAANPTPAEISSARESLGLTQQDAADLLYLTLRAWQRYEAGERRMHPALWELFRLKTGMLP